MSQSHLVTGVPRDGGGLGDPSSPRLNIFDLVNNTKMFHIYVQAIERMQAMDQPDALSYFSIAAIHGLPKQSWDHAPPATGSWYCHHGINTFPTWHRPYCALFEQVLNNTAVTVASEYTTRDKAEYQKAAQDLRAPFWDWASQAVPPPEVISLKNLTVIIHNGTEKTIVNPLFQYTFHPLFPNAPPPAAGRQFTVRCPRPGENVTSVEDLIDSLQGNGDIPRLDWRSASYDMLTRTTSWDTMANGQSKHGNTGERDAVNSLEVIHGNVHVVTGGNGHMASVPVAAYDPIFWMHHMNVDRMLTLWQAIRPTLFLSPGDAAGSLAPFWNTNTTFWNSTEARGTQVLNYTYPEFVNLHGGSAEEIKSAITDEVNRLYGPTEDDFGESASLMSEPAPMQNLMNVGRIRAAAATAVGAVGLSSAQAALAQPASGSSTQRPMKAAALPKERTDWTVRIRTKLHQFGQSYTVLIFVGEPPATESKWRIAKNFVGAFAPFVNDSPEGCANCKENADAIVEGYVGLAKYLHRTGELGDLESSKVTSYLAGKQAIQWRIQIVDTTVVPPSKVEDLEVAVMSVPLRWSETEKSYQMTGRPTHHPQITTGRAGGRSA